MGKSFKARTFKQKESSLEFPLLINVARKGLSGPPLAKSEVGSTEPNAITRRGLLGLLPTTINAQLSLMEPC